MKMWLALFAVGALLINNMVDSRRVRQSRGGSRSSCVCGVSDDGVSNRIVGGVISIPHIFPWLAAIFNKGALHCGGALINDRYVLTAGHCVKWTSTEDLSIALGMHDIEKTNEGQVIPIDKVILHEKFESDYLHDTHDIALIRLKRPVRYNENIRPVCLPAEGSDHSGRKVKVAGWGRVTASGTASQILRQAELQVMSFASCKNTSLGEHLTESMLCAYTDDTDACQGDSGGPLLHQRDSGKYETIGVVSWGIGCAKRGMPGVYVKNADYLKWIEGHTKDATYCTDN